jgi:hypothetical protein
MSQPEFVIQSAHGKATLTFVGSIPGGRGAEDGYDVQVLLAGGGVEASERVWDHLPQYWAEFFLAMARDWRGWEGERTIESREGQLRLACSADKLGHVSVRVTLRGDPAGSDWRAEDTLYLDAGQLDELAQRATDYFGQGLART